MGGGQELKEKHSPKEIRQRIEEDSGESYLGDAVLGAVDGSITTFAVVAGAIGGEFSTVVTLVLGISSLLADGISMGVSNYLGTRSQTERIETARAEEHRHIREIPEGERREIREIFAEKGVDGRALDEIVEVITEDRELWVDTMLQEELNLPKEAPNPLYAGGATFGAFIVAGIIPLLPFLVPGLDAQGAFLASIVVTAITFFVVGLIKGAVLDRPVLVSGLQTLLTGGGAALVAYFAGGWLRELFGVNGT
jgi:VIT1/CCC1 family predicted Fe2+/Mn2+ transporter